MKRLQERILFAANCDFKRPRHRFVRQTRGLGYSSWPFCYYLTIRSKQVQSSLILIGPQICHQKVCFKVLELIHGRRKIELLYEVEVQKPATCTSNLPKMCLNCQNISFHFKNVYIVNVISSIYEKFII